MKDHIKLIVFIWVGVIVIPLTIHFVWKLIQPASIELDRKAFEQSRAYNEGVAQEIQQLQIDYIKGNAEQKQAIKSIVKHKVAGYNLENLPSHLREFVNSI
jgi:hypothetical protein